MPATKGKPRGYSEVREYIEHAVRTRDASVCWLDWPFKAQYSEGRPGVGVKGRKIGAVHYAYSLIHDEPSGQLNHSCNKAGCWNPTHVYDGNQKQNTADMVQAGTGSNGTATKLTAEQVVVIRERYADGESSVSIASDFGITASNISAVVRGKSWNKGDHQPVQKRTGGPARIDPEVVRKIRDAHAEGFSGRKIARAFSVSESTVSRIVRGVM
jgi:transposase